MAEALSSRSSSSSANECDSSTEELLELVRDLGRDLDLEIDAEELSGLNADNVYMDFLQKLLHDAEIIGLLGGAAEEE